MSDEREQAFLSALKAPKPWVNAEFAEFRAWLIQRQERIEGCAYVKPERWLGRILAQAPVIGTDVFVRKDEVDADFDGEVTASWQARGFVRVEDASLGGEPPVTCYACKAALLAR